MLMDDEVVLGSDREAWLCYHLLFKFGEWFSHFSGEDEWRQIVKSLYHFGNRPYVLLSLV